MAWVPYANNFKDLWNLRNDPQSCFTSATKSGNTTWQDGGKLLRLGETTFGQGGYLTFTVGPRWKLALRIATENVDWFQDEVDPAYLIDAGAFSDNEYPAYPTNEDDVVVWEAKKGFFAENDSEIFVTLNEGDILVIDVDADVVPATKAFRIYKNGVEYIADYNDSRVKVNEDTFVRMLDAFYFVEDAPSGGGGIVADEGDGDITVPVDGGVAVDEEVEDEDIENPIPNPDKDPDNPQDSGEPDVVIDPYDGGGGGGNGGGGGGDEPPEEPEEDDKTLRNIIFIGMMVIIGGMIIGLVVRNRGGLGE